MTLRQQQSLFVRLTSKLIDWATENGYELTYGETWRSDETAQLDAAEGKGIVNSLHRLRLAVDWNLFRDGVLLTEVEDYRPLAESWKTLHPLCRAGIDFAKKDAVHFSLEWQGIR